MKGDAVNSKRVKVPAASSVVVGYGQYQDVPASEVEIQSDGAVVYKFVRIGYVQKGHRTYSPPTHKGSRIVKYHKQVPEWHGHNGASRWATPRPRWRCDTRQEVLQRMLAAHLAAKGGAR